MVVVVVVAEVVGWWWLPWTQALDSSSGIGDGVGGKGRGSRRR